MARQAMACGTLKVRLTRYDYPWRREASASVAIIAGRQPGQAQRGQQVQRLDACWGPELRAAPSPVVRLPRTTASLDPGLYPPTHRLANACSQEGADSRPQHWVLFDQVVTFGCK